MLPVGAEAASRQGGRSDTYRLFALFGAAFEQIRSEYVDPVSDKKLIEAAIDGMLTGLDPHSAYMNAHEFREMAVQATGEFGGVGIEVVLDHGLIKIVSRMDDTPASRAGIEAGDIITNMNGKSVRGFRLTICLIRCADHQTPASP